MVLFPPKPSRWPLLAIHSSGPLTVLAPDGTAEVRPSRMPEVAVVLNHMLTPRLAVPFTRPLALFTGIVLHELTTPGVVHHVPSSGIHELVPLNDVAVTPEYGPGTPRVVLNSVAGGSTVVMSLTGIWLAAAVEPVASFSR